MKSAFRLLARTFKEWRSDNPALIAAGLSFFSIFSLAPLLLVAVSVTGRVFQSSNARQLVTDKLAELTSPEAAAAISSFTASFGSAGNAGSILGLLVLTWAASRVVAQLQTSLRVIWAFKPPERRGWRKWAGFAFDRSRAVFIAIGLQIFLLVFFVADVALAALQDFLARFLPWILVRYTLPAASFALSLAVFTLLFAMTYRWLPQVRLPWRAVLAGGACASFLFTVGRYALTLYIRHGELGSLSGVAGSIVVALFWVYFSAHVFLFGAEFAWAFAHRGSIRQKKLGGNVDEDEDAAEAAGVQWESRDERRKEEICGKA